MTVDRRDSLISTRASKNIKASFAALASTLGMTESSLLTLLISTVLEKHSLGAAPAPEDEAACSRISLRLRPGDRALLDERAARRCMKTANYAVLLIRAHVRQQAPLPAAELQAMKLAVNHLTSVRRDLLTLAQTDTGGVARSVDMRRLLQETAAQVEDVRQFVANVVRINLKSWETGDA